mgnify:FL=1
MELTQELYKRLTDAGVEQFQVRWSGGSDEGYLDVEITKATKAERLGCDTLHGECKRGHEQAIADWADKAWSYSGAGDGHDYGDDYTYDLKKKTVEHCSWEYTREESDRSLPMIVRNS